jgi:KaiC/GvpD/RAD55 family RecA-like ATPase
MAPELPILGIPDFDERIGRFLPSGWLGLLVGDSGAGMQLLAKQFAHVGLGSSAVYYYTTYERPEDLRRTFGDYGWNPDGLTITNLTEEYYARVLDRQLEVSRARERGLRYEELAATTTGAVSAPVGKPTARLLADLSSLDSRFRLVLDSLDFILEVVPESEVLAVARQIRRRTQSLGGQALLVLQADVHERRTTGLLEDLADILLELHSAERGGEFEQMLTVRKVRNHPELTRRLTLKPSPNGFVIEA